jgi:hypothetical protein
LGIDRLSEKHPWLLEILSTLSSISYKSKRNACISLVALSNASLEGETWGTGVDVICPSVRKASSAIIQLDI